MSHFQSLDDKEMDSLITFFSINGYMGMPNRREISDQISEIAQKELLDTPRPLYEDMRRGIPSSHMSSFWAQLTIDELSALITSQRPTPTKVVDCILAEGEYIRPEEEKVLYFLKQFVRGLDQEDLMSFLHFVTGSIHMPDGGIKVSFTKLAGELRRPIVHTCSNLIEISVLYSSFQEFRREMTQYLRNELAFHFSVM
ncbi:uncharacterized protein [Haliotis asinina]|uniref:uncharacterized protein n=1 Tax=Haliotis asinina TaxID=109174 RepID=UPI00353237EF